MTRLYKWKIKNNNSEKVDSIEHHLYYCTIGNRFWNQLKSWTISNLSYGIELTVCGVLFGIPSCNNPDLKIINFLIHIGKWYLNNSKTNQFISLILFH